MGCGASSAAGSAEPTPADAPLKPFVSAAPIAPPALPACDEGVSLKVVPAQHSGDDTLDKGIAAGEVVSAKFVPSRHRRPSLDEMFSQAAEAAQRAHAWLAAAYTPQPPPLPGRDQAHRLCPHTWLGLPISPSV
jgi:hypothetical protein